MIISRSLPNFRLKIWIFFCLFIFGFFGCTTETNFTDSNQDVLFELTEGWAYRWGDSPIDNEGIPVWTYEDIDSLEWIAMEYNEGVVNPPNRQNRQILWLRIPLPEIQLRDPQLRVQFIGFACEAYLENVLFFQFKAVNVPGQGKFTENQFNRLSLNQNFQNKHVFFRVYSEERTHIGFGTVHLGSFAAFTKRLINEILTISIFGILFMVAGLFPLLLFLFKRKEKLYFVFGFFCFIMGLWILSPTEFGHQFLSGHRLLFLLTSVLPFLSAAGMCAYFEQVYGPGKKYILRRLWQFFLTYGGIALILLILKLPYSILMLVMVGFFAAFSIAIFILFFTSVRKALQGNREAMVISSGFAVLTFFGLFDILGGIFKLFPWTHNTYQWGMFVFIVSLGFVLERRFRQNALELEKSHEKLQEYSQTLEKKVKERTHDLEEKNTELASTLKELKNTQDQLIMQEKMASLGNLVAGVAHEINTPVGAVKSAADVLSRSLNKIKAVFKSGQTAEDILASQDFQKPFQTLEENTQITTDASERIVKIVKSLKSFARLDEAEYQKADIHEGLDSTLTLINYEMKGRITIHKDYGEIPEINCYPNQLNQVFMNILMNGIASIEKDGFITIKTFLENENLVVQISDNGSGISKENIDKLFDPGFTTRGHGVGTGLGLSISYNIIQKHQGEIKVETEVGKGSTFSIYLPIDLKSQ